MTPVFFNMLGGLVLFVVFGSLIAAVIDGLTCEK